MRRSTGGRTGGRLLIAAGLFTLVNNYLPGSSHLELAVLNVLGVAAVVLGLGCLRVPWDRLPLRAPLLVLIAALVLLSVAGAYGDVSAYSYAVYYVVVFVWVGIAQPPGTSLAVSPLAALAYVLPFLVADDPPATALGSVTVAIPVCVLVGEVLSRSVARLEASQAALQARAEHEAAVVDVLADGVLVLDAEGRVRSCNAVAAGLLGAPREQLVGAVPPLAVGPPGTALHHSVGDRWIETVATELVASRERVVVLRDISRQRALDEAKDLFLATTSHELRTPLTAIKGYVHVLERRWEVIDEERRRQALATISERTDALVALTDHLLLGARASASRHSAPSQPFALVDALRRTLDGFEGVSERHRVVLDVPAGPLVVLGDPTGVHHVVTQLLENAVKYSPRGGTVTVTARAEDGFAAVEVADEGVGVPEGGEAALFTPFFQAGQTNTREYGGVGLGLYIVRQLVEAQGGAVTARNRPGGGALLRFTLPLSTQPATPPAVLSPAAPAAVPPTAVPPTAVPPAAVPPAAVLPSAPPRPRDETDAEVPSGSA